MNKRQQYAKTLKGFAIVSCLVICPLQGQSPSVTDIAFAPDGKTVLCSSQKGIQVYTWPRLALQNTIQINMPNVHCIVFSPDGKQLAVGGGHPSESGAVETYTWPQCHLVTTLGNHDDAVLSVAWRGNQRLVSASHDRSLTEWNLKTQKPIKHYRGHSRGITSICILKNGEIVSVGHDQSVRVWDPESTELIRSLNQHTRGIQALAICPNHSEKPMIATAAADRTLRFWQPTIGRLMRYIRLGSEPLAIAWVNESQVIASCVDGQARLIDSDNVKILQTIPGVKGWAYAIAVHPNDGSFAIAGSNGQLRRVKLPRTN
ncbi:MAG: WD40 repeat domain-containing protein [Planctomycetota bacterium]|nr:WD40 repeat domain-containing protein [Planctomycetota bacterium]